ncbi:hypothetical protein QE152_g6444 [Popillia japonica]|uniref:CCHC-type domain-containing protein n=1 Tax=Popillia japonica TaxID=7064 RepID=A0AAW1MGX8_POPJA
MDVVATAREIGEVISKITAISTETSEAKVLRSAYGSKQNATIVMHADANKLLQIAKIKMGWTNCKIIERKSELRCYRCWEDGHIKFECNGIDKERLCLKCAKEGHIATACPNQPFCIYCKQEGHQTGSLKCPETMKQRTMEVSNSKQEGHQTGSLKCPETMKQRTMEVSNRIPNRDENITN